LFGIYILQLHQFLVDMSNRLPDYTTWKY